MGYFLFSKLHNQNQDQNLGLHLSYVPPKLVIKVYYIKIPKYKNIKENSRENASVERLFIFLT